MILLLCSCSTEQPPEALLLLQVDEGLDVQELPSCHLRLSLSPPPPPAGQACQQPSLQSHHLDGQTHGNQGPDLVSGEDGGGAHYEGGCGCHRAGGEEEGQEQGAQDTEAAGHQRSHLQGWVVM